MNTMPTHEQIDAVLDQLSPEQLFVVANFVDSLSNQAGQTDRIGKTIPDEAPRRGSTAKDLLEFAGTWEGDDLRECLQLVKESRTSLEF